MDIEDFKNLGQIAIEQTVSRINSNKSITVEFDEMLVEPDDNGFDEYSGTFAVTFKYGNCERVHTLQIDSVDQKTVELGIGEDGDTIDINYGNVLCQMYFDLALDGLDDKYLQ